MDIKAIDMFCGAGGLTCGLRQAGINVVAGFDLDENCEYAYKTNNGAKFIKKRIQDVTAEDLNLEYGTCDVRVLVGCAPCQPFSSHTKKYKKGNATATDERWYLINDYLRLIKETKPDVVSMENVPNLAEQEIFHSFVNKLRRTGYSVSYSVVFCPDYGIPQKRYRLVLLASKHGRILLDAPSYNKKTYRTVRDAISGLAPIAAGECSAQDLLHRASRLSSINLQRIKSSVQGGTWRDWDNKLLCNCHRKGSGQTYSAVYARMEWDKPSPTITTEFYSYGTGRFGHPEQDRAISLREGALLQTFPPEYQFTESGNNSFKQVGKMIGNAVPVALAKVIGQSIVKHLSVCLKDK